MAWVSRDGEVRRNRSLKVRVLGRLTVAAVFIGLAGCSLTGEGIEQKVQKVVWKSRDSYVRLESPDALKGTVVAPNAHPVSIGRSQLYNALKKISLQEPKKKGSVPLFSEWELDALSINLADALSQARPDQDVTFAIVGWHKSTLGLKQAKVTTGRVFYQGGKLNIIFGEAQRTAKNEDWVMKKGEGDRRIDPYVPGMRSFTKRHAWRLMTAPGSGIYHLPGVKRGDWIVIAASAFAAPPAPTYATTGGGAGASEVQQLRQEVDQLRRDLQGSRGSGQYPPATYQAPQAPAAPAYQPPAPSPPTAAQTPGLSASMQQRLMVLDDLRSRGLISDQEYETKRNQILSGL